MEILILSIFLFTCFSYIQSYIEIRFDQLEVNSKIKFKEKHTYQWFLRTFLGLAISIAFFYKYELKTALILTMSNGVALMCYYSFIHGSFYQMWIKRLYGVGKGFTGDSQTAIENESYYDRLLLDTFENRCWMLSIYLIITLINLIYINLLG